MPYKKKSVHLEDSIHKKLKKRAFDKDSTIEQVLSDILKDNLKKELKSKRKKKK